MLKLYISNKDEYPKDKIEINNDAFFNHYFDAEKIIINPKMADTIKHIDETDYDAATKTIKSKFIPNVSISPKELSTGCKTVLNVMAFPRKIFSLGNCGDNAISELLDLSNVLSEGCAFTKFVLIPPLDKEVNIQVIDMDNGKKEYVTNTTQLFNILSSYFSEWGSLDMLYDNYNITTNGVKYSLDFYVVKKIR